jgi:hypothetical protein
MTSGARTKAKQSDDSGFVDVAANALAIVILVTVIAVLLSSVPQRRGEVLAQSTPPLAFPVALDPTRAPLNSYWYVTEEGLTEVTFDKVATALASGETTVNTELATFYFQNARSGYRDLDEYRLDIRPNMTVLRASAQAMYPENMSVVVEEFEEAFANENRVPTFLVLPDGYQTFARFYAELRQADLALRWRPVQPQGVAVLVRTITQFETGITTWR